MTARAVAHVGRYLSVGMVCAIAHNGIMITGDFLKAHYILSFIVSFCIVTPLGYGLHMRHTFKNNHDMRIFWRFTHAALLGTLFSFGITALLCSVFGQPASIAALIATFCLFIWNYVTTHWAMAPRSLWRASPPKI